MKGRLKGITFLILFILTACDKEISVSPPPTNPENARLSLASNPTGYSIHLNGRMEGKWTPDSLTYLTHGEYMVELVDSIYLDTLLYVDLPGDTSKNIFIDVTANPRFYGKIEITSSPSNANIILNGESIGQQTPYLLENIFPGYHQLEFLAQGFRSSSYEILVKSDEVSHCRGILEDTTIWLVYNSSNSMLKSDNLTCFGYHQSISDAFWVGTSDKGIVDITYFGWENYDTHNSILPSDNINDIEPGLDGKLFIATNYGLVYKNNNDWQLFNSGNSSLESDIITSITPDLEIYMNNEQHFITTNGSGIYKFKEGGIFPSVEFNQFLPSQNVSCFDLFWDYYVVGTRDGGVLRYYPRYSSEKYRVYNQENSGFFSNNISAVCIIPFTRELYVAAKVVFPDGTAIGKLYFNDGSDLWEEIELNGEVINTIKYNIGKTWVATNNGVYQLKNYKQVANHFTAETSLLPSNFVYDLVVDRAGNIWMCTGSGLIRYKPGEN